MSCVVPFIPSSSDQHLKGDVKDELRHGQGKREEVVLPMRGRGLAKRIHAIGYHSTGTPEDRMRMASPELNP